MRADGIDVASINYGSRSVMFHAVEIKHGQKIRERHQSKRTGEVWFTESSLAEYLQDLAGMEFGADIYARCKEATIVTISDEYAY